jgi:hypothetical protein
MPQDVGGFAHSLPVGAAARRLALRALRDARY